MLFRHFYFIFYFFFVSTHCLRKKFLLTEINCLKRVLTIAKTDNVNNEVGVAQLEQEHIVMGKSSCLIAM